MLVDILIQFFVLLYQILLFLLLGVLQLLTFLSVIVYELHPVKLISKMGHLSLLSYLLKFLLLNRHLLFLFGLFVLLESEVSISDLFWLPVHDVTLGALHLLFIFLNF